MLECRGEPSVLERAVRLRLLVKCRENRRFNVSPGTGAVLLKAARNSLLQTHSEHESKSTFKE